jgi:hypothetical protein
VGIFHRVHVADSGSHTYLARASSLLCSDTLDTVATSGRLAARTKYTIYMCFAALAELVKGQATAPPWPEKNFE